MQQSGQDSLIQQDPLRSSHASTHGLTMIHSFTSISLPRALAPRLRGSVYSWALHSTAAMRWRSGCTAAAAVANEAGADGERYYDSSGRQIGRVDGTRILTTHRGRQPGRIDGDRIYDASGSADRGLQIDGERL
jgi:hypothetical protein